MQCLIHKWDGCKCSRCGKVRDEQHAWIGCKCSRCGKVQNIGHNYIPVPGKCTEKCAVCGKELKMEHTWEQLGCVLKCSVCGVEKASHLWVKHQCSVCGTYDDAVRTLFNAPYVNTNDEKIGKLLDSLSQKALTELAIQAKCGYVCHEAEDRVHDTALLARIADESDNSYIVKQIRLKFICPHCGAPIDAATLSLCKCHSCGNEAHDFYTVEDTKIDRADFTCGIRYEKCKRCGKETEHKEFSHYWEGH